MGHFLVVVYLLGTSNDSKDNLCVLLCYKLGKHDKCDKPDKLEKLSMDLYGVSSCFHNVSWFQKGNILGVWKPSYILEGQKWLIDSVIQWITIYILVQAHLFAGTHNTIFLGSQFLHIEWDDQSMPVKSAPRTHFFQEHFNQGT